MSETHSLQYGRQPLVLIVDDNPAIRNMVAWALELDGYEPAEAAEGQEALDWLDTAAREGRYPAVILLDLAMPGMDGDTFLQKLQQHSSLTLHPLPAVVIVTAGPNQQDSLHPGAACVIVKPFHVRDLLDIVRRLTRINQ